MHNFVMMNLYFHDEYQFSKPFNKRDFSYSKMASCSRNQNIWHAELRKKPVRKHIADCSDQ